MDYLFHRMKLKSFYNCFEATEVKHVHCTHQIINFKAPYMLLNRLVVAKQSSFLEIII
jgi:hypothetical protein